MIYLNKSLSRLLYSLLSPLSRYYRLRNHAIGSLACLLYRAPHQLSAYWNGGTYGSSRMIFAILFLGEARSLAYVEVGNCAACSISLLTNPVLIVVFFVGAYHGLGYHGRTGGMYPHGRLYGSGQWWNSLDWVSVCCET